MLVKVLVCFIYLEGFMKLTSIFKCLYYGIGHRYIRKTLNIDIGVCIAHRILNDIYFSFRIISKQTTIKHKQLLPLKHLREHRVVKNADSEEKEPALHPLLLLNS